MSNEQSNTVLMQQAALASRAILEQLLVEQPDAAKALEKLMLAGQVQFDVVIRDVLGGVPRVDLVAITAEAEQRVVGSRMLRRTAGGNDGL